LVADYGLVPFGRRITPGAEAGAVLRVDRSVMQAIFDRDPGLFVEMSAAVALTVLFRFRKAIWKHVAGGLRHYKVAAFWLPLSVRWRRGAAGRTDDRS
jgi:hypothetical protein